MPTVPQRRFIKGVNAATPRLAQSPNSVPRASNLVFTRRGSLSTVDGSRVVLSQTGIAGDSGMWLHQALYSYKPAPNVLAGIKLDKLNHGGTPVAPTLTGTDTTTPVPAPPTPITPPAPGSTGSGGPQPVGVHQPNRT